MTYDATTSSSRYQDPCAICSDMSQGVHFGVVVCRACAAFFRRSINTYRVYKCRFNGNCVIDHKAIRCSCRACRFKKCLELGMGTFVAHRNQKNNSEPILNYGNDEHPVSTAIPTIVSPRKTLEGRLHLPDLSSLGCSSASNTSESGSEPPSVLQPNIGDSNLNGVASTSEQLQISVEGVKTYTILTPSLVTTGIESLCLPQLNPTTSIEDFKNAIFSTMQKNEEGFHPETAATTSSQIFCGHNSDESKPSYSSVNLNSPTIAPEILSSSIDIPLIKQMYVGYQKLIHNRRAILSETEAIPSLELRMINYSEISTTVKFELALVAEMIKEHFIPSQSLSLDGNLTLLRNFFGPFASIHHVYNTLKRFPDWDETRVLVTNNLYLDLKRLDEFFDGERCKTDPKEIARERWKRFQRRGVNVSTESSNLQKFNSVFAPTFQRCTMLFRSLMNRFQISEEEIVALFGLLFWNERADGLTDEERKLASATKQRIYCELYQLCCVNSSFRTNEAGIRFGSICNMVPLSSKTSFEFAIGFSLANMTKLLDVDNFLQEFNPRAF